MKVTILLGSVREGRQTHRAAYYLEQRLKESEIETDLIDLAEDWLPVLGYESGSEDEERQIKSIGERLDNSDALIFVTPEYQASFSGVIKNAIDHYYPEFNKKPIGIVAASAGGMAGINAAKQLQQVILGVGGFPMPLSFLVPGVHNAFDDSYTPQNEKVVKSADQFLEEFLWFAGALTQKRKKEEIA
jgi:NAD(P)H-dependent FMN reductase